MQYAGQLVGRRDLSDMRRTGGNDLRRTDACGVSRNLFDQGVGEDVLGDGDGESAAKGVEEDGHGVARRHVLLAQHDLDGDEGDLDAGAGSNAGKDLIPNPHACTRRDLERV